MSFDQIHDLAAVVFKIYKQSSIAIYLVHIRYVIKNQQLLITAAPHTDQTSTRSTTCYRFAVLAAHRKPPTDRQAPETRNANRTQGIQEYSNRIKLQIPFTQQCMLISTFSFDFCCSRVVETPRFSSDHASHIAWNQAAWRALSAANYIISPGSGSRAQVRVGSGCQAGVTVQAWRA